MEIIRDNETLASQAQLEELNRLANLLTGGMVARQSGPELYYERAFPLNDHTTLNVSRSQESPDSNWEAGFIFDYKTGDFGFSKYILTSLEPEGSFSASIGYGDFTIDGLEQLQQLPEWQELEDFATSRLTRDDSATTARLLGPNFNAPLLASEAADLSDQLEAIISGRAAS